MRVPIALIASCALAAAFLSACGSEEPAARPPTPAEARAALAGSPPPLAALHAQASELLPGDDDAFARRLRALKGYPVVVNAWATWCPPCKEEFPILQRMSVRYGGSVAFLGLDVRDDDGKARSWLRRNWVAYPSYSDPDERAAREIGARVGLPTTVFYGTDGEVAYLRQGRYRTDADLERDLQRYLGAKPSS